MALAQVLASLSTPANVTLFETAPVVNLTGKSPLAGGQSVCGSFWGEWDATKDCLDAVDKLPTGAEVVLYTIDRGEGRYHLPQGREHGTVTTNFAGEPGR